MICGYSSPTDRYLTRLRRIEGQVRGFQRMVSEDEYYINVLTRMSAIQSALHAVALRLLEGHMNHCVINTAKGSDEAGHEKTQKAAHAIARLVKS